MLTVCRVRTLAGKNNRKGCKGNGRIIVEPRENILNVLMGLEKLRKYEDYLI
jgi:hypothetical protein